MRSKHNDEFPLHAIMVTLLLITFVASCAVRPVNWTGSVDAVFKYKSKQKSTVVHKIRQGSFSEKAGLKPNDVLLAVDGNDVSNTSYEMVRAALRGPAGTFAVLTVKREETILDVEIERKPVRRDSKDDSSSATNTNRNDNG